MKGDFCGKMGVLHRSFLMSCVIISFAAFAILYCVISNVSSPQEPVNRVLQLDVFWPSVSPGSVPISSVLAAYDKTTKLLPADFNIDSFQPFSRFSDTYIWDIFPPQMSCPDVERVGHIGDGGKWLCALTSLTSMSRPCLVYSYGISTDASFEYTLASAGCVIHAFDPSVGDVPAVHKSSRITFHKQGLANHTGYSSSLMIVEHLIDTMTRLNHSYIDILKVDVEGAEWSVFAELFGHLTSSTPLFGQLLIELHFSTVKQTVQFFEGMHALGYYSYSREINLQPCVAGGLPVAVEYSFLHPKAFDQPRPVMSDLRPVSPPLVTRGVIYYLTRHDRVVQMSLSLKLLYENVHRMYMTKYPVLIFHDDLTESDRQALQSAVPFMPLTFILIEFRLPSHLQSFDIPDRTKCSAHSSTIGYRHMIMFHATWIHDYLLNPVNGYSDIEYIWRLDDDSQISSPIGYDIFQFMATHEFLYGFVNTLADDPLCVEGMWDFARSFIQKHEIPEVLIHQFSNWTEGVVVYNNFEISRVTIWKHPLWRNFINAIDESGKVYTHRWGDAPIHTIIMLLLLAPEQIHVFTDLPYRHLPFVNQTATGLPHPHANAFTHARGCSYYNGWKCHNNTNSSTSSLSHASSPLNPLWMQRTPLIRDDDNTDDVDDAAPLNTVRDTQDLLLVSRVKAMDRGVLYTFAHTDRIDKLAQTLQSFYTNYIRTYKVPLVVFYPKYMNVTSMKQHLRQSLAEVIVSNIVFSSVNLDLFGYGATLSQFESSTCGGSNLEFKAASLFLASDAIDVLHRMGYNYFFRFADDSALLRPVMYDVFDFMMTNKKLYGFVSTVKDSPSCIDGLWEAARRACESVECSLLLNRWPVGSVVYTNFEISHISVWRNPVFVTMVMLLKQQLSEGNLSRVRWSDAGIHTMGVITGLTESQMHNFHDIRYQANLPYKAKIIPYSSKKWTKHHDLERFISPRRFGWIGGDVGASFLLPSSSCSNAGANDECNMSRYVWLFGDSLIGTSSLTRRIEGTMVSNSVAIAHMDITNHQMVAMKYFWKSTDDGRPLAIFESREEDKSFWPYDGVSIFGAESLKIVVLGQMSMHLRDQLEVKTAPEALSFELHRNVIQIVNNPYDVPELWSTEEWYFPESQYQWTSLAVENGKRFGQSSDMLYILGLHRPVEGEDELFSSAYHVLGRVTCSDAILGKIENISILNDNGDWQTVSTMSSGPRQLFPLISSEASLHFNHRSMLWTITGLQVLTVDIVTCTAKTLDGEWTCSKIAPVDERFRSTDYISYAARTHPELDANTSTVVSYVTNFAGNPSELFQENHMGIYYPTFVKLFS